jgi:predicted RNA-binding protein Jag
MTKAEMNHYADTRQHFFAQSKEGVEQIGKKFERVWKLSRSYAKLQEARCNYELSSRQESREANMEKEITAICEEMGFSVSFDGDPRGYTVKVKFPQENSNTWGGKQDGWGIA